MPTQTSCYQEHFLLEDRKPVSSLLKNRIVWKAFTHCIPCRANWRRSKSTFSHPLLWYLSSSNVFLFPVWPQQPLVLFPTINRRTGPLPFHPVVTDMPQSAKPKNRPNQFPEFSGLFHVKHTIFMNCPFVPPLLCLRLFFFTLSLRGSFCAKPWE